MNLLGERGDFAKAAPRTRRGEDGNRKGVDERD